jgi:uncharacterized membrane protein
MRTRPLTNKDFHVVAIASFTLLVVAHWIKKTADIPLIYPFELLCAAVTSGSLLMVLPGELTNRFLRHWTALKVLGSVIALYCTVLIAMLLAKFSAYHIGMYDLGLLDQIVWNTAHGHFFEATFPNLDQTCENMNSLGIHFELFSALFALMYRLVPDARVLLIAQTLLVGLSIMGCFLVAKEITKSTLLAQGMAILWALFPALHFANLFDVHGDVLAIPFIFFAYYFFLKGKSAGYWIMICLALVCKEYVCFALAGLGVAIAIVHNRRRTGVLTILVSSVYFAVVFFLIMPALRAPNQHDIISIHYSAVGGDTGFPGMAAFFFAHPEEIIRTVFTGNNAWQVFFLFLPMLFLPFLSPTFLTAAIPILAMNLLAGMDIGNHRLGTALPIIFIAAIRGISSIRDRGIFGMEPRKAVRLSMSFCVSASLVACFAYGPTPLGHRFWRELDRYVPSAHHAIKNRLLRRVPDGGAVSASDFAAFRLAHRRFCYLFPRPLAWGNGSMVKNVDWIVLDTTEENCAAWDRSTFRRETFPVITKCGFSVFDSADGIFLFRKNR